ncbi:MAG: hypothetical protein KJ623_03100 [Nanoarchaeota archaeon]|nr:hypothetical protein [Nanoarchaeota archaeon]MBU0962582.1 hypothetical protein [Nanoarchaeota archaeon]
MRKIILSSIFTRKKVINPETIKELELRLEEDKKNPILHIKLADYIKRDDKTKAIYHYITAAEIMEKDGFYSRAAATYKQALTLDESMLKIHLEIARCCNKLGLNNEACIEEQKYWDKYKKTSLLIIPGH